MKRRQAEKIWRQWCGDSPALNWNRNTITRVSRWYTSRIVRFTAGVIRFQEHLERVKLRKRETHEGD